MTAPTRKRLPRGAKAFNKIALPLSRHLPIWAELTHVGRKSGREYKTPIAVIEKDGVYNIGLAWGKEADWVRNVMAAGEFTIVQRGKTIVLTNPQILHDPAVSWAPAIGRPILRRQGVADYIAASPR